MTLKMSYHDIKKIIYLMCDEMIHKDIDYSVLFDGYEFFADYKENTYTANTENLRQFKDEHLPFSDQFDCIVAYLNDNLYQVTLDENYQRVLTKVNCDETPYKNSVSHVVPCVDVYQEVE